MTGRGGPLPPSPSLLPGPLPRSLAASPGSLPAHSRGGRSVPRPPLLSHFSWEPRAALSYWRELAARRRLQHARTRAGLRGLRGSYPRPREEGETGTHRGEEEEDKEGGRKPARRTGAGGGRLATFSPPASAQGAPILTDSARRWIFPASKEKQHVPVPVEMICSSARRKLTE